MKWYLIEMEKVFASLGTGREGLSAEEAARRLQHHGPNELRESGGRTRLHILWEQLTATMVIILIAAAVAAALLGDMKNAIAILTIVVMYAALGFFQEYRAERAMAALKRMAVPTVRVFRDGEVAELPARELVPGDVVLVEAGNVIPADGRVVDAANLQVQESALTGESEAVAKTTDPMEDEDSPLGDRRNMVFLGTTVTRGRGTFVVTATGMQTELGNIATLMQQGSVEQTPLQRRLDRLGKNLAVIGVGIAAAIFALGMAHGDDLKHMMLVAVSVAVAIVPEGLPAVVTITLALGAQRMLRRNALIRRLTAVETLGSVTVICSDKTGTLTQNRMTVVHLETCNAKKDIGGESSSPVDGDTGIMALIVGAALCNDAHLSTAEDGTSVAIGDPTEGALVVLAARSGIRKEEIDVLFPRSGEIPFDSERKRMTTIHRLKENTLPFAPLTADAAAISFTKGSVDGLLPLCSRCLINGSVAPLEDADRIRMSAANDELARRGIRVMGVSFRLFSGDPVEPAADSLETDQIFIGLVGMIDPPRQEVKASVVLTRSSGIRTAMITGDHPLTAMEIARQLGLGEGTVLTGAEIDLLTKEELHRVVDQVTVFARVSPEHKLKIIEALQAKGHVVSMTGDGVNDAPALRRADIGVAMGITGTDVSKEASDLVLLDDNFATIVSAVAEGRTIYDNIRKFVRFSVAGNLGKVLVMLLAPLLGKPIPLLPLQLLWLNLLTDGLLGLGLGVEPPEDGVMQRPPSPPREGVFTRASATETAIIGLLIGSGGLAVGAWYFFNGYENWRTMIFTTLAFSQVGQAIAIRTGHVPLARAGVFGNPLMALMVVAVISLQLLVVYFPPLQPFFATEPLMPHDLAVAAGIGGLVFIVIEASKFARSTHRQGTGDE